MPSNLLDSAMSVVDLLTVYLFMLGYQRRKFIYFAFGGLCIYLAFLIKGPIGLFPLVIPVIYHFVYSHNKSLGKSLLIQSMVLFSFALVFCLILLNEEARGFLATYLNKQVFASLAGEREKADTFYNHFSILVKLS